MWKYAEYCRISTQSFSCTIGIEIILFGVKLKFQPKMTTTKQIKL